MIPLMSADGMVAMSADGMVAMSADGMLVLLAEAVSRSCWQMGDVFG